MRCSRSASGRRRSTRCGRPANSGTAERTWSSGASSSARRASASATDSSARPTPATASPRRRRRRDRSAPRPRRRSRRSSAVPRSRTRPRSARGSPNWTRGSRSSLAPVPRRAVLRVLSEATAAARDYSCALEAGGCPMSFWEIFWIALGALVLVIAIRDLTQRKYPVLRIFPVLGHLRYFLMEIGPELRQYIVAQNREELPFNRSEREWIYRSANGENNYFGFGTDDQVYGIGYPVIKHAVFGDSEKPYLGSSHDVHAPIPCAKTAGVAHGRKQPYQPPSIVNVSAMSFGALGRNAIAALNTGAKLAGCYHNTGEGGCSRYHRLGADVVFQIGTGYFGARDANGFNLDVVKRLVADVPQIRMIEIKLSQGAKPGKGGVLPGIKVTSEIAEARGVAVGQ